MQTIIKIAVVSALALFTIAGVVSISKAEAQNQLKAVNADELLYAQKNGAVIIDIRREEEWKAAGVIEGAELITAFQKDGSIHPEFQNKFFSVAVNKETPIVLYCRTGNRTKALGNALISQLGFTDVRHLSYGIKGWKKINHKTIKY